MSGYARMRRIIEWLDTHHREQPGLAELASLAELGESQFHREFVRWTGVTPKDFLQCLTLRSARERLAAGAAVLDAALDSGLSGPGRLHDLCVGLEAASPGEIKRGGAGLQVRWGMADTPFGTCLIGESPRGVCHLSFVDGDNHPYSSPIAEAWPEAELIRDDDRAANLLDTHFCRRETSTVSLRAWVRGTDFQVRVWRALLAIPPGHLTTYRRIAEAIGQPTAARAVGTAIGANPVGLLIPCHRVIRETGVISGYRWGSGRKRALIAWEGPTSPNRKPRPRRQRIGCRRGRH